jgi:hypothetical protein
MIMIQSNAVVKVFKMIFNTFYRLLLNQKKIVIMDQKYLFKI